MKTIGERIRHIRKYNGLIQKQFGELVGISDAHVSKIESGKDNPSYTLVLVISSKFMIEREWILSGEGIKQINSINSQHEDEDSYLENLNVIFKRMFESTDSIIKKQQFNQILLTTLNILLSDRFANKIAFDESSRYEYLSNYLDVISKLFDLVNIICGRLADLKNRDVYKKLYAIQQEYDIVISEITDSIRKMIFNLCEEKRPNF